MKSIHLFFALFLMFSVTTKLFAQIDCSDLNKIRYRLKEIHKNDQSIRKELIPVLVKYQKTNEGVMDLVKITTKMKQIDKNNQNYIDSLITKCGWPSAFDKEEASVLFLVVDHADEPFMEKHFKLVEKLFYDKKINAEDFYTLNDRYLMRHDQEQLYGTQSFNYKNVNYIWPIKNHEKVDIIRKEAKMPLMNDYIKSAKDSFQVEIVWDKTMTLEKAIEMKRKEK